MLTLGLLILGLILWENLSPMRAQPERFRHVLRNSALFLVARLVFFVVSLVALERLAFYSLRPLLGPWFVVYVFVVSDLSVYWWHRLNHRVPFLWRFHQVHHADPFLDFSTALRFHFGELALSYFVRGSVFLLLGFEVPEVVLYNLILTAANLFHHSNITLPEKLEILLSKLIVTPKFHRTHHSLKLAHTDSNYSALWVGWDGIFASHSGIKETPKVGVPYAVAESITDQLSLPFKSLAAWPELKEKV